MSKCIDPQVGKLLHAYELNALSQQETELFEIHLVKCEHCFEEIRRFEQEIEALMSDDDVKKTVAESAEGSEALISEQGTLSRLLWPRRFPRVRIMVASAVLLALVLIASPHLLTYVARHDSGGGVQTVSLVANRNKANEVTLESGAKGVIFEFLCEGAIPGQTHHFEIRSIPNSTLDPIYPHGSLDSSGIARVEVQASDLQPGLYVIVTSKSASDSSAECGPFYFRVRPE
jgi:hypothetical protein